MKLDAEAVLNYAIKYATENNLKVYIYGRSLGGAVSIYISSHE